MMNNETVDNTMINATGESSATIVAEFQSLQQKSGQLFDDLRYLPQFGQKMWQPYFGKTFSLFTKANHNCVT